MKSIIQKIGGGWTFLIIALLIYGITALVYPTLALPVLTSFGQLMGKILPILAFVFVLIFIFNLFLEPKTITKYVGRQSGWKGWVLAIVGGIISMGAIYMWYPLLADLKEKGMSNALVATFLYNRAIKLQLLPFLIYYFGWTFTIIMTIYMIIFSVINGLLVEKFTNNSNKE
ncbi:hypothetical protein DRH29_02140 [candidate division Kazan bacterium]|uniref:Permease n=1 Tax=candidate division Kazan bacterium TaxID=2202143 RepID=A0A420ZCZ0_UNCK3|nr:MAG: hypothetical protein DRH29_02140 [candidate division Kazan bacterium]